MSEQQCLKCNRSVSSLCPDCQQESEGVVVEIDSVVCKIGKAEWIYQFVSDQMLYVGDSVRLTRIQETE